MSELEQCMKALEAIGKSRIQKSATYQSPKVAKACAIARGSETPEGAILAKRIMQLQRQQVMKALYGPELKAMGLDREESSDDEWSRMFSKADDSEDEDELRRELRDLQDREREITERIRALHFGGR
jgi:hypothetical protein